MVFNAVVVAVAVAADVSYPTWAFTAGKDVHAVPADHAFADFDGDGDLDVAVAAKLAHRVLIFRNDGPRTLTHIHSLEMGSDTGRVEWEDFNGDGRLDVLAGGVDTRIFLSLDDGTWSEPVIVDAPGWTVEIADLDADGDPDLLSHGQDQVASYVNDGVAGFGPPIVTTTTATHLRDMIPVAFNQDPWPDLVVVSKSPSTFELLAGDGSGGFQLHSSVDLDVEPLTVRAADLNADGIDDLAIGARYEEQVCIWMGSGAGAFRHSQSLSMPTGLTLTDVDGDGDTDIVGADTRLEVMINDGRGFFARQTSIATGRLVYPTLSIDSADLDGDGDTDVVVGRRFDHSIVFVNPGDGRFAHGASEVADVQAVHVADLDESGFDDVVLVNAEAMTVRTDIGRAPDDGGTEYPVDSFISTVVDVDLDGDLDVVGAKEDAGLTVRVNDGTGHFDETVHVTSDAPARALAAGDLDGDGARDVIAVSTNIVSWWRASTDGLVDAVSIPTSRNVNSVATGDFDGDGDVDVAVAGSSMLMLANDGSGNLTLSELAFPGSRIWAAGDVDADGADDLFRSDAVDLRLFWGGAEFVAGPTFEGLYGGPETPHLADVNGDGLLDVIAGEYSAAGLWRIWLAAGDRTFAEIAPIGAGGLDAANQIPAATLVADLDRDGAVDLVAASDAGWTIMWSTACTGDLDDSGVVDPFDLALILAEWGPCATCNGDLDGDGHVNMHDLLVVLADWGRCR